MCCLRRRDGARLRLKPRSKQAQSEPTTCCGMSIVDHSALLRPSVRLAILSQVQRVAERFDAGHRRALIVQATGTGKTRVAVAITEMLLKAGQAKRVLFLCDRLALRKQAKDAFAELLPAEPLRVVDGRIPSDPP